MRVLRQRICIAYARESLVQLFGNLARSAVFFLCCYRLGTTDVLGTAAGERKFRKAQGIGAVGRGLARGDQLVGGGNRVTNDSRQLDEEVVRQRVLCGPIGNIGTHDQSGIGLRIAVAVVHALLIGRCVKLIGQRGKLVIEIGCSRNHAAHSCGCGNASCIHERHAGDLSLAGLGALAVGEVTRGVAQGKPVVGRHVTCTEARTAEGRLDHSTLRKQRSGHTLARQLERNGNTGGVDRERECTVAHVTRLQNGVRFANGFVHASRTTRDHALICVHTVGIHLARQGERRTGKQLRCLGFHTCKQLGSTCVEFVNGVCVGGVEGQRDHGFDLIELDFDHAVVVSTVLGGKGRIIFASAVRLVKRLGDLVGCPDGRKTRGFGGHDVNAVTEIHGEVCHTGADKFQNSVLDKAAREGCTHQRKRNVMRTDAATGLARQIYQYHLGGGNVVGVAEQLLDKLGTALTDSHGAQSAVAGVGVGAENHASA